MVPATVASVIIFLVLVAPGICYELLRRRTVLPREESAFVEISRVLLSGTLITALAGLMWAFIYAIAPSVLPDLSQFISRGTAYAVEHLGLIAYGMAVELSLAILLAVVFSDLRTASTDRRIYPVDAWHAVAELIAKPGLDVGVSVRLKSGAELVGYYNGASTELDSGKRELILARPFYFRPADNATTLALNVAWERLVVSGSQIDYIATSYIGEASVDDEKHKRTVSQAFRWVNAHWLKWQVGASVMLLVILANMIVSALR